MPSLSSAEEARRLDQEDELAAFRGRFVIADPNLTYLNGNSLGRLPAAAVSRLDELVAREWGGRLIRGWNEGWFELAERLGARLAPLLGAAEDEVILADSTSVNLFKVVAAALQARPGRNEIVTDDLNFPSDLYVLQGAARLAGPDYQIRVVPSADGVHGPAEGLIAALRPETALVALSHVTFQSSYAYDLPRLTAAAQAAGALAVWDLSHSAGALPVGLNSAGADLAVGCTYKYLNGGPGAPSFLFVRRDLQARLLNPISGWMGQRGPFELALDYTPADGLRRFLTGTPPILSLAAVEPGLDLIREAGLERIRAKSVRQSQFFIALFDQILAPLGFWLNSPRDPGRRGSHVSLGHVEAWRINRALIEEMQVLPDFRRPDTIRFGIAPLYTTFTELYQAAERLRQVVVEERYARLPAAMPAVT
ncbi:MAG: kynureninase [Candidatus Promineifilaceae bacterium]